MSKTISNLYLYDPQFEAGAKRFQGESPSDSSIYPISSVTDLKTALSAYDSVKYLIFDTHGEPGKLTLADGTDFEGMDFMIYATNASFLSADARVLFLGCNVGEGTSGDMFLKDVGRYLFKGKGGTAGASTVTVITASLFGFTTEAYMSPFSTPRLKVKRYDGSGVEVGSVTVNQYGSRR